MSVHTADFSIDVEGVEGLCPSGERHAELCMAQRKIPVFSCEGPCIRGEIARLAANLVAKEVPGFARACHAETLFVPHSGMASWVKGAETSLVIDGCFLKCQGRALKKMLGEGRVIHIDALPLHRKFSKIFLMDDVPYEDRLATAREVADTILARFEAEGKV
jgi:hypothetical protein